MWAVSSPRHSRGHFLRLLVDPAERERGIGTALAARAFQILFQSGCREISLVAVEGRPRERFYSQFGFQKTGTFLKLRLSEKKY